MYISSLYITDIVYTAHANDCLFNNMQQKLFNIAKTFQHQKYNQLCKDEREKKLGYVELNQSCPAVESISVCISI